MLKPLYHLSLVLLSTSIICYDQLYVEVELPNKEMEKLPLKARSMFLTMWCMIVQLIYHFIALINDIIGTNEPTPKTTPVIRKIKDSLFALAFVNAIYVTFAFWNIYAIGKELIIPKYAEKLYPPLINQLVHTSFSIFIIIELLTSHINYPSRRIGFSMIYTFYITYVVWYFNIYARTGEWVYPVFNIINWPVRIIFIVTSLAIVGVIYIICEKTNKFIHPNQNTENIHADRTNKGIIDVTNGKITNGNTRITNGTNGIANGSNGVSNGTNGIAKESNGVTNGVINSTNRTNGVTNGINSVTNRTDGITNKFNYVTNRIVADNTNETKDATNNKKKTL